MDSVSGFSNGNRVLHSDQDMTPEEKADLFRNVKFHLAAGVATLFFSGTSILSTLGLTFISAAFRAPLEVEISQKFEKLTGELESRGYTSLSKVSSWLKKQSEVISYIAFGALSFLSLSLLSLVGLSPINPLLFAVVHGAVVPVALKVSSVVTPIYNRSIQPKVGVAIRKTGQCALTAFGALKSVANQMGSAFSSQRADTQQAFLAKQDDIA